MVHPPWWFSGKWSLDSMEDFWYQKHLLRAKVNPTELSKELGA